MFKHSWPASEWLEEARDVQRNSFDFRDSREFEDAGGWDDVKDFKVHGEAGNITRNQGRSVTLQEFVRKSQWATREGEGKVKGQVLRWEDTRVH